MSDEYNVVDFDENLRLIGTAHVSSKSVETVKAQILEYSQSGRSCSGVV